MIVNLIEKYEMYTLALPTKVKGQYWLEDKDGRGQRRKLISIEAVDDNWEIKNNRNVKIIGEENVECERFCLEPYHVYYIEDKEENEKIIIYAEEADPGRQILNKYLVHGSIVLFIGRTRNSENAIVYENEYVSRQHATLSYDGQQWRVVCEKGINGTYVNGKRVTDKVLEMGDSIYIMGLRIVVGNDFLGINNPENGVTIYSSQLTEFEAQPVIRQEHWEVGEPKTYFFRSPRFYREIKPAELQIDSPPPVEKLDTMPWPLKLGSSDRKSVV